MGLPESYYVKDRYVVIIGSPGSIDGDIIKGYLDDIKETGYVGIAIYLHESLFPIRFNEFGILEPDFDSIYDKHGLSEFERRLNPSSPNYTDPYSLLQDDILGIFRNIDISSVFAVLFDSRNIPWADVELRQIFTKGDVAPAVYDIAPEDTGPIS